MDGVFDQLFSAFKRRNIAGVSARDTSEALEQLLGMIPLDASVGFSGSVTLEVLGIIPKLEARGNRVFNQMKPGLSRQEGMEMRRLGSVDADYYLTSANAIAQSGELVFLSAYGHRIAGIAAGRKVIVVAGVNKLAATKENALKRAREYATPLNCKRLNWPSLCLADGVCKEEQCYFPEQKRMCCQLLVIEAEVVSGRLTVVMVNENLGY